MKAKEKKVTVKTRKPYERLSDNEKKKIVHEINSGLIGQSGEFGRVDHTIPWQIDHQQTITGHALNSYQSFT